MKHTDGEVCLKCESLLADGTNQLINWFKFVKMQHPDIHTSCVYRGEDAQNAAFAAGASRLKYPNSAHNDMPARAADLFQQVKGVAVYDPILMAKVSDESMRAGYRLKWGGSFVKLGDACHFEFSP